MDAVRARIACATGVPLNKHQVRDARVYASGNESHPPRLPMRCRRPRSQKHAEIAALHRTGSLNASWRASHARMSSAVQSASRQAPRTHARASGTRPTARGLRSCKLPGPRSRVGAAHAARIRPALWTPPHHTGAPYHDCAWPMPFDRHEATASNGAPLRAPKLTFLILARSIWPVGVSGHAMK